MDNTHLIGLSQQTALRRQLDIIANNLANLGTAGFHGERAMFEEFVMPVAADGTQEGSGANVSYVQDVALFRDFAPGRLEQTGKPLDVAIDGEGWFTVETADGERYTRAGNFRIDEDGRLVTLSGDPVLGNGGEITFAPEEVGIEIAADGTVSSSAGEKGQLAIVTFVDERALVKEGGSLYASPEPAEPVDNPVVRQGVIELSNVNPIAEITQLVQVTRAYESTARMLSRLGELQQEAIQSLGTLQA